MESNELWAFSMQNSREDLIYVRPTSGVCSPTACLQHSMKAWCAGKHVRQLEAWTTIQIGKYDAHVDCGNFPIFIGIDEWRRLFFFAMTCGRLHLWYHLVTLSVGTVCLQGIPSHLVLDGVNIINSNCDDVRMCTPRPSIFAILRCKQMMAGVDVDHLKEQRLKISLQIDAWMLGMGQRNPTPDTECLYCACFSTSSSVLLTRSTICRLALSIFHLQRQPSYCPASITESWIIYLSHQIAATVCFLATLYRKFIRTVFLPFFPAGAILVHADKGRLHQRLLYWWV